MQLNEKSVNWKTYLRNHPDVAAQRGREGNTMRKVTDLEGRWEA